MKPEKQFLNTKTEIMLSKAKEMLISSYKSTAEISFECGFNTPTYFSKLFKFLPHGTTYNTNSHR